MSVQQKKKKCIKSCKQYHLFLSKVQLQLFFLRCPLMVPQIFLRLELSITRDYHQPQNQILKAALPRRKLTHLKTIEHFRLFYSLENCIDTGIMLFSRLFSYLAYLPVCPAFSGRYIQVKSRPKYNCVTVIIEIEQLSFLK